jgi:hypothetical protein
MKVSVSYDRYANYQRQNTADRTALPSVLDHYAERLLFAEINGSLAPELKRLCRPIRDNIADIVRDTLPEQLRQYTKGFTETWIPFNAGVFFLNAIQLWHDQDS